MVVEGSVTITAAGETREMLTGDAYVVPSNLAHQGVAGANGVVLVETFVPIREEYAKAWRAVVERSSSVAIALWLVMSCCLCTNRGIGPVAPAAVRVSGRQLVSSIAHSHSE